MHVSSPASPPIHQYWFLSGLSVWEDEQGRLWTEAMQLREEETSHWGLCSAVPEWWKDQARKWNFSELCITAQCHRAFCGFYQHTGNDSPWQQRSVAWQHPLLLKRGWAASLTLPWSHCCAAAGNLSSYFYFNGRRCNFLNAADFNTVVFYFKSRLHKNVF